MLNARYTEKVRDSLSITQETTAAIGTTPDLNQLLRTVFSNLQESFPDAIPCVLTYNEDDNLLEFAPASLEFYRIESPEYEGLRILHLNGSSIACRVARQSLRTQKIEVENVGNVSEDADYLPVNPTTQAELCASLFSGGRLLGVIVLESSHQNGFAKDDEALILNLARQISLAIERVQQNAQLKFTQAVAQATAWAADVAHDLNREVGVIRKCAYLIHEKADQPEQVRHYVELIEKSSAQLASVGLWQPTEKPIELDPFIRRAVTKSTENRKEKIEVEFALDCAGVSIRGNPIALERVIRQLVRNAAQAMAKSAKRCLIVSTRLVEAGMVEIQFTDSGPGVDEEIRPLILHQPTSTKRDEGGYGLLLIRQMVEDMHGKIRLLPGRSDTGATFAIRLPVRENSERQDGGI